MSKKSLTAAALFSAAVLGGAFFATTGSATVNAAQQANEVSKHTGNAYVSFTNDDPTGPLDHDSASTSDGTPDGKPNPGNPSDGTGDVGELTLDAIPSVLNFGSHKSGDATSYALIPNNDQTGAELAKTGDKAADQPKTTGTEDWIFTQVSNHSAKNPTWALNVQLSDFKNLDAGTTNTLKDASISFADEKSQLLDSTATNGWAQLSDSTDVAANFELKAGDTDGITYIPGSTTTGTTQQAWQAANVLLKVAQSNQINGNYAADMTWTLSSSVAVDTTAGQTSAEKAKADATSTGTTGTGTETGTPADTGAEDAGK